MTFLNHAASSSIDPNDRTVDGRSATRTSWFKLGHARFADRSS